ncbi:insulinase family protein [Maribacter algarum]|uniref:Insulinase family protein n=1 Tax=Maribacter algarum (ex Zhang et al. 2020) TaxID=2578118 RepID=A0A5S3QEW5_9FLAO|nr:M16 family metallopeptidase [Maribacter algarum]TMM55797.1 insulinase family protein [Maribacter algarum]
MFTKFKVLLFLIISFSTFGHAQVITDIPLPDSVRHGKLQNGMTYYIMHNSEPKERVSFYFAQNVGAILEEDDEDGLAHFLEHMAFNGSKNFPGRSMDEYLESRGLKFGRDFNAYTSTDETLYNIDNVPVNDTELIDKSLLIMHDWSGSLSLVGKDIDEERGVIEEEWRSSRSPDMRIREKVLPIMFAGSKYADRDVIGDQKFIQTFEHESLRNYYKKWYRPDLQAVIIVGDIDIDDMEDKVKKVFSKIPLPKDALKRPYYEIPDNRETSYVKAVEKGASRASIQLLFKEDNRRQKDSIYLRQQMIYTLFKGIINGRYDEIVQKPSAASSLIDAGRYDMALYKGAYYLEVNPKLGMEKQAVREGYSEIERAKRFGFLKSEFEREKLNIITEYQNAVSEEPRKTNYEWAAQLSEHFFSGEPVKRADHELEFVQNTLTSITINEVQAVAEKFNDMAQSIIVVTGPDDEKANYPSKEDFLKIIDDVKNSKLDSYQDNVADSPLIAKQLTGKPLKGAFSIHNVDDAKGYILDNGAKIVFNPSKKKGEKVAMKAISFGGLSLIDEQDLPSANGVDDLIEVSGLGAFDKVQLSKKLAGRTAEIYTSLKEYTEELEGESNLKDIELLMQLTYLYFEDPFFDQAVFEAKLPVFKEQLAQLNDNEQKIFYDSLNIAMTNRHVRGLPVTPEDIDKVNFEKSKSIYQERFTDADDFVFVFTGNFNQEEVLKSAQKYLGNITTLPREEKWRDNGMRPKNGFFSSRFERAMPNPQTSIFYGLSVELPYTLENELLLSIVKSVLDTRYVDTIREEEGGSYGVRVLGEVERIPSERMNLLVVFNCNPEKQEELLKIVKEEISTIAKNGPNVSYVEKTKKNLIKNREEQVREDGFREKEILNAMMYESQHVSLDDYQKAVEKISPEMIQNFMQKYVDEASVIEVIMNPKKEK